MDVETIYKDKLKGKYQFMFDLKEKQVFDNQYNGKKKLNWYFSYWIWEKCMFPNGAFDSRCNLRWKAYWFGNFTTEEPYD